MLVTMTQEPPEMDRQPSSVEERLEQDVAEGAQDGRWQTSLVVPVLLVALAVGLSVDNLAVGFSLGLGEVPPVLLATTIAAFSMAFTWVGLGLGNEMRRHWERRAEIAAGALLVALAVATAAGWL
jgi:putative Mn2+ efflux pump MntP